MNRVAWTVKSGLSRISVVCSACTGLLRWKCEVSGDPFYSAYYDGQRECEACGQTELSLISAS